jgi:hypothetical protein
MKRYEVLWIDDDFEKQDGFIENAYLNSIDITPFKTSKSGMEELTANIEKYDVVILDAKVYDKSEDEVAKLTGLMSSITKIKEVSHIELIPYFIYTGQPDVIDNTSFKELMGDTFIFKKPSQKDELFQAIKNEADQRVNTRIKHKNQQVFSIFDLGYLPSEVGSQVLELIKTPLPLTRVEIKAILSNIRSIHESCFLKLEEINVISNATSSINNIIRELSGNITPANGYQPTTIVYQNDSIENLHKWIYFTCGKYIHNLRDENYNGYMISGYAVESIRNGILEILLWFKKTYEEKI